MTIAKIKSIGKFFVMKLHNSQILHILMETPNIKANALVVILVVLSTSAGVGLGFLYGLEAGKGNTIQVQMMPLATSSISKMVALPKGGQVTASRTGLRYYAPWCGGSRRISAKNRVWFSSRKTAEAAGYTPAKNCSGL